MKYRILLGIGALILGATAVFHATGYSSVQSAVAGDLMPDIYRKVLPGLWLFFSLHLLSVAVAAAWIAVKGISNARSLLVFCAAVVCLDTAFVIDLAGIFPGTILLLAASLILVVCAIKGGPAQR